MRLESVSPFVNDILRYPGWSMGSSRINGWLDVDSKTKRLIYNGFSADEESIRSVVLQINDKGQLEILDFSSSVIYSPEKDISAVRGLTCDYSVIAKNNKDEGFEIYSGLYNNPHFQVKSGDVSVIRDKILNSGFHLEDGYPLCTEDANSFIVSVQRTDLGNLFVVSEEEYFIENGIRHNTSHIYKRRYYPIMDENIVIAVCDEYDNPVLTDECKIRYPDKSFEEIRTIINKESSFLLKRPVYHLGCYR